MAYEFKLPDLGEGIHEGQIVSIDVQEGETVSEDQTLMEVETDKATVPIPSPKAGRIAKWMVKAGDTAKVGQVLVAIEESAAAKPAAEAPRAAAAQRAEAPAARAPAAEAPQAPQRAEAPARAVAAVAPAAATVGGDGAVRTASAAAVGAPRMPAQPPVTPAAPGIVHKGPVPATPNVRRRARELNVDLRTVPGSGPGGRVMLEDIERLSGKAPEPAAEGEAAVPEEAQAAPAPSRAPSAPQVPGEGLPDFSQWGPVRREPAPQIRKTIARQMMRAWLNVPRVTHGDDADLTDLEAFRKQHGETVAENGGGKLSITAFILKALAATLQRHPKLNCSYDGQTDEIVWKQYVHIGVAVDTPRGLIVPCLRDVDKKGLATISKELNDLSARVRENKFDIADLRGGTFTLSNVGALGGTFSTPMVNYPETAILVTGRLAKKPVVMKDDRITVRAIMPLCLSFDHRIIDGADAARFTKTLIEFLENPVGLLISA